MSNSNILEPLIQDGITCLQQTSKFISVCYHDGAYEFNIKHSGNALWVIITILCFLWAIPLLIIGIYEGMPILLIGFVCLYRTIVAFSTRTLLRMNSDHTVQIIEQQFGAQEIYDIPRGECIEFTASSQKKTISFRGSSDEITIKTILIKNTQQSDEPHPYVFKNHYNDTIDWLEQFFTMLNSSSWISAGRSCTLYVSNDRKLSFNRVYDKKKYAHATLSINLAYSVTPILHTKPSFDDHQYVPAPSKYRAIQEQYHNLTPIGNDAQSAIFRALDKSNRPVCIKVYDFTNHQSWKEAEQFERNVNQRQRLHCKGTPKYYDFIDDNPLFYLIESYIPVPSMAKRIQNGERISLNNASTVLMHIAEILNYMASLTPSVIHRNINPDNILIDDNHNVWLVGFDIVAAHPKKDRENTIDYRAPEQRTGDATPVSDTYSAGLSMLSYLTGKAPSEMAKQGSHIDVLAELPTNIPDWFKQLIIDMTDPVPATRLSKAASIAAIIRDYRFGPINNNSNIFINPPNRHTIINTKF